MYSDYDSNEEVKETAPKSSGNNNIGGNSSFKLILLIILLVVVAVVVYFMFLKDDTSNYVVKLVNNPEYIEIKDSKKIAVTLNGQAYNGTLEWSSANKEIVEISNTGVATAHKLGETTLTATYKKKDTPFIGTGKVIVYKGDKDITLESVEVPEGELILKTIGTYNLTNDIVINPKNSFITKMEFTSSNPSVVTIDEDGMIESVGVGEAQITLNINDDVEKTIKVVVSNEASNSGFQKQPEKITFVDGSSIKVKEKELKKLEITIEPSDASKGNISWKSSDEGILTVDGNGNILGSKEGKVTVTATSDNGVSASIDVEVEASNKEVEKIEFNQSGIYLDVNNQPQLTIKKGDTLVLTPVLTPSDAVNKELTFDVSDSTTLTVTPSQDKTTATIVALKTGTAKITVKSSNNISTTLTVTIESTGSSTSSGRCYCNSSSSSCVWSASSYDDYTIKQANIPNASACSMYAGNGLCFKTSSGEYRFGKYGNVGGYTYVAGATNGDACTKRGENENAASASLKCNSGVVGGTTSCTMSTNRSPYTLRSASSSNESVAKVTVGGNKITVECVAKGSARITGVPANGLPNVSDSVTCSETNFKVSCPSEVAVGRIATITSSSTKIKCSGSSEALTVSSDCKVTGAKAGSGTVTITSTENTNLSKTCKITVVDKQEKDAELKCNDKVEGDTKAVATCTNCTININSGAKLAGTYEITATAKDGHLFSNGSKVKTISCTIKSPNKS